MRRGVSALIALAACASPATIAGRGIEVTDLDRAADPCTDFYQFATGGWRASHPIPASAAKWSRRAEGRETNRVRLQDMLEQLSARRDWPAGSGEQVLGDYYASCMDEAAVDTMGLAPLGPWRTAIDGAVTIADIERAVRRLHEIGVAVPFAVVGMPAYHDPARFIANVVAPAAARDRGRITLLLKLGGDPDATRDADAVFALETRLAGAASADPIEMVTFAQLEGLAPHFDWATYFSEANLPRVDLGVADRAYLQRLDKELLETPVAVWRAYLEWRLLDAAAPWLAKSFAADSTPRRARCVDATEELFGERLGREYAERYFPEAAKAKAEALVRALTVTLRDDVERLTWMQPATKATALAKVSTINLGVGYPPMRKDRAVAIDRGALWANVAAARRIKVDDERRMIGNPTPRDWWQLPSSSPDAYIEPALNQLVLPAGYLQRPIFDAEATDAYNFGAIGVGVAHDLTHSIDASGSEIDTMGRPANWWTDADRAAFAQLGACVVEQFESYEIEPGVHLDGKRVLSEALGDLAGIQIAYAALEKSMAVKPVPNVDGFTPAQQFFLAWAQFRGEDVRLEAQRTMIATDSHAVPRFRINGTLASTPAFQRAFSCKAGSPMVRPKPCAIWIRR